MSVPARKVRTPTDAATCSNSSRESVSNGGNWARKSAISSTVAIVGACKDSVKRGLRKAGLADALARALPQKSDMRATSCVIMLEAATTRHKGWADGHKKARGLAPRRYRNRINARSAKPGGVGS